MSQSPAGSQLDSDDVEGKWDDRFGSEVAIPRRVSARFRLAYKRGERSYVRQVSQSPQGLSSIPTGGPRQKPNRYIECRNPPQGLSSIPTGCSRLGNGSYTNPMSQSPAGSQLDSDIETRCRFPFRFCEMSQSPAGSQLDSDPIQKSPIAPRRYVAIPRRVSARFRPGPGADPGEGGTCRNPPQGLSSIPTDIELAPSGILDRLSQSPAGSQLDSDRGSGRPIL